MSLSDFSVSVPNSILFREVHGEAVLLNADTGIYFGLDEVGTQMWRSLTTQPSMSAAEKELQALYAVEPERLHEDLHRFVEELVSRKLLVTAAL
jgi:hypothetical protein